MRRRVALFVLAASALGSTAFAADAVLLALDHDRLTARDLAGIVPEWGSVDPASVVAYAPLPGVKRRVSQGQLVRWGKRFGLALDPGGLPSALVLSRRMRELKQQEAEHAIRAAAAERHGVEPEAVLVEIHGFDSPLAPAGTLTFQVSSSFNRLNEPNSVSLRWRDSGGRSATVWLQATIAIVGSYALARESLAPKTELSAGDFDFHEGPLPGSPKLFLLTSEEVVGMSLRHSLKAGEALPRTALVKHPTVRRGGLLELQVRSGPILLRVPGRAEQPGSVGDTITCRNLESGKTVMATILDSKHAEVEWVR